MCTAAGLLLVSYPQVVLVLHSLCQKGTYGLLGHGPATVPGCVAMASSWKPPPRPVSRNQQCLTAEPGVGSCARFSPKIRPRNQGLVLAHDRGQPRTVEKNSGTLRRRMRALSFPTVNHIDR